MVAGPAFYRCALIDRSWAVKCHAGRKPGLRLLNLLVSRYSHGRNGHCS